MAEPFLADFAARSERHSRAVGGEWKGDGEGGREKVEEGSGLGSHLTDEGEDEGEGLDGEEHGRDDHKHRGLLIFFPGERRRRHDTAAAASGGRLAVAVVILPS